jgi:dethiobiotin synthetase/adenosylmethionine--8-amino-7-oxononanoate aminotransferase
VVLVETAGGVHSPTPSGTSQADLYRPLRLPVFLVADPKLGGISSTISAFESLHVRGYDLDSVFVFEDDYYKNHDYLSEYFYKRGVHTMSLPPPPLLRNDIQEDKTGMAAYYERMSGLDTVQDFVASFHQRHNSRIERLESMALKAHKSIWYPFTQHQDLTPGKILAIDSAYGDFFQTLAPSPSKVNQHSAKRNGEGLLLSTFDASASWWTQGLGHGSSELSLAAAYAAGRYGHVMFAGAINEPALSLAELLLENLENPRLQKVFYSDDGSTGVEVAVKMALTASSKRYGWDISNEEGAEMGEEGVGGKGKNARSKEIGIIGLKGSYHGDTIGAMDCSEGSTYNDKVHWYEGRGYWFDFPQVKMKNGDWILELPIGMEHDIGTNNKFGSLGEIFDKARDKSTMRETYEKYINKTLARLVYEEGKRFGAVVLEPIILGAGGMLFW